MRMKPLALASLLVLSMSACGSPRDEDVLTQEKIRASESAPELPEINLSENPEPPPAAPPKEEPTLNEADNAVENGVENAVEIETQGSIPPAFQALWGKVPSDCRPGTVVGTGMLVSEDALLFADSATSLLGVLGDYPQRFAGRFGDENGFEQREELVLTGGGNVLIRTSGGQRSTYRRCGARPTG
jgi:hypothetical protein